MSIQKLYKKNKTDVKSLQELLLSLDNPIISIEPCRGYIVDNGKTINVCKAKINGQKTLFSVNLVNFLKDNHYIEVAE